MHSLLAHAQRRFFIALCCLLFGWMIGNAVGTAVVHADQHQASIAAAQEQQFWRMVAGDGTSSVSTVDVRLADDLRAALKDGTWRTFRAPTSTYGGITRQIGRDPFNEAGLNCDECGPLDAVSQTQMARIAQGNLSAIDRFFNVPAPAGGLDVTPFDLPVWQFVGLFWMLGGPLTLFAGYAQRLRGTRTLADVSWWGGTFTDPAKLGLVLMAPSFWVPYNTYQKLTYRKFSAKVEAAFPDECKLVDDIDRALAGPTDGIAPDHVAQLQALREGIVDEIEAQTRNRDAGDPRLQVLVQRAQDSKEFLETRKATLAEMRRGQ